MEPDPDVLRANAYHEAGRAIVGWTLGLYVQRIATRDGRPAENTKFTGHAPSAGRSSSNLQRWPSGGRDLQASAPIAGK